MNMEPKSLQNVFDSAFSAMEKVRETYTPQLTPHEVGTIISIATGIAKVSGLPGVGFDELVTFCSVNTGISMPEMKSSVRVGSWTSPWAMNCWDASSTRWVGHWMAAGR